MPLRKCLEEIEVGKIRNNLTANNFSIKKEDFFKARANISLIKF